MTTSVDLSEWVKISRPVQQPALTLPPERKTAVLKQCQALKEWVQRQHTLRLTSFRHSIAVDKEFIC